MLALATGAWHYRPRFSIGFFAEAIGIGLAVGIPLTLAGTWLQRLCKARGRITETWRQLPVVAVAFSSFAASQELGGSGQHRVRMPSEGVCAAVQTARRHAASLKVG